MFVNPSVAGFGRPLLQHEQVGGVGRGAEAGLKGCKSVSLPEMETAAHEARDTATKSLAKSSIYIE